MNLKRIVALAAATFTLAGCVGALVPIQTGQTVGIQVLENSSRITVVSKEQAAAMQDLGEAVGYSCKNKIWEPAATADAATYQVRVVAALRGATAITGLSCEESSVSLVANCWQSYRCTATALK